MVCAKTATWEARYLQCEGEENHNTSMDWAQQPTVTTMMMTGNNLAIALNQTQGGGGLVVKKKNWVHKMKRCCYSRVCFTLQTPSTTPREFNFSPWCRFPSETSHDHDFDVCTNTGSFSHGSPCGAAWGGLMGVFNNTRPFQLISGPGSGASYPQRTDCDFIMRSLFNLKVIAFSWPWTAIYCCSSLLSVVMIQVTVAIEVQNTITD